jgi:hypothetical protein
MKHMSSKTQRWLKGFHILFACWWVGAAMCLSVKLFFIQPVDGMELYGITATLDFIDIYIIIPGAMGCLVTGILYSTFTPWGWFKHNWIIVKWVICIYGVVFGTYPLGPWMSELVVIAKEKGLAALTDPTFMHNQKMLMIFGTFQALTITVACFISVLKPWKKKG